MAEVEATHGILPLGPSAEARGVASVRAVARRPEALTDAASTRFRALVEQHFDFIWRSLRGLGVPSSAVDDAAQHVFCVASEKLGAIAAGSERAFLFKTALGVAANARRAIGR